MPSVRPEHAIDRIEVSAYTIPTDQPEADGTFTWTSTTLVLVEIDSGDVHGLGFSYTHHAAATLIQTLLAPAICGYDALAVSAVYDRMQYMVRNLGRTGLCASAIAAVDTAVWDLKARLLGVPLVTLLGQCRECVPIYGSGGFTSYSMETLRSQLGGWASQGIPRVKMKVGTHPEHDVVRVRAARDAVGPTTSLFVDANGAYDRKQALAFAERYRELDVTWFEEPVTSDDLEGLHLLRNRAPSGMDIAAGEYGYDLPYFRHMLDAHSVDVLQADATRCAGITGFLRVGALCSARSLPLSAHTAPSVHAHPCCAVPAIRHLEWFHDHVRIEHMLFDGTLSPVNGCLVPDLSRPGMGLEFKRSDAKQYAIS